MAGARLWESMAGVPLRDVAVRRAGGRAGLPRLPPLRPTESQDHAFFDRLLSVNWDLLAEVCETGHRRLLGWVYSQEMLPQLGAPTSSLHPLPRVKPERRSPVWSAQSRENVRKAPRLPEADSRISLAAPRTSSAAARQDPRSAS